MSNVSAVQAKLHFNKLLDRVSRGEEVVIMRDHKPVARLIPEGSNRSMSIAEAVDALRAARSKTSAGLARKPKVTLAQFRAAVAEGRR